MKKIILVTILLITVFSNIQLVYAGSFNLGSVFGGANGFLSSGQASAPDITNNLDDTIKGLVSAGLAIGTIVAVCTGIVIAIKTMLDGANGKKELKEALTPYVIACVVLFGSFGVWSAAVQIMESTIAPAGPGGGALPSGVLPSGGLPIPPPGEGSPDGGDLVINSPYDILAGYPTDSQGYYIVPNNAEVFPYYTMFGQPFTDGKKMIGTTTTIDGQSYYRIKVE